MIDPTNIIKYGRTKAELEELILFLVMVANHNAQIEAIKLEWFLAEGRHAMPHMTPLQYVWYLECQASTTVKGESRLMERLRHWRISPYGARYNAFWRLAMEVHSGRLDLTDCPREQLAQIPFISMKTASLFVLDSRPDQRIAALDTHILAELRAVTGYKNAPETSPQNPVTYLRWEQIWLDLCDLLGKDPAAYDLEVWTRRSQAPRTRKEMPISQNAVG